MTKGPGAPRILNFGRHRLACSVRSGGEELVLFLHGLGCSRDTFAGAFETGCFPPECTLVAPDLPGHGDSSKPLDFSYSFDAQTELLLHLLATFDCPRISIVAHSMGGVIGLKLAEALQMVGLFVCLEGNLIAEDCRLSGRVSSVDESTFVERIYPLAPLRFRGRGLQSDPEAAPQAIYRISRSLVSECADGNLLDRYRRLRARTVYVHGDRNGGMAVLERLDGLTVISIPNAGHFMMIDNPVETYAQIRTRLLSYPR